MKRRTYYVTAMAGAYVAGHRVQIMEPGPSGAVELLLTAGQAEHELLVGSLSEKPPAAPEAEKPEIASDGPPEAADPSPSADGAKKRAKPSGDRMAPI